MRAHVLALVAIGTTNHWWSRSHVPAAMLGYTWMTHTYVFVRLLQLRQLSQTWFHHRRCPLIYFVMLISSTTNRIFYGFLDNFTDIVHNKLILKHDVGISESINYSTLTLVHLTMCRCTYLFGQIVALFHFHDFSIVWKLCFLCFENRLLENNKIFDAHKWKSRSKLFDVFNFIQ